MGGVDDRVAGLEAGGDDYLTKPFAFAELRARIGALARRPPIVAATSLGAGDLEMDLLARTVTRAGKRIELLAQEFKILEYLLRHAGEVVTRTMLLEKVWDFHFDPKTNIVETHISRLRSKIDKGFDKPLLHTIRGLAMSSGRLIRILRSASFRLPLLYAVLFILSAGALFVTVYWTATAAMQSDMSAVLRLEAYQLAEVHRRSGLSGLADQITRRINFRTRGPIFYLLQAPNRRVVVGNLPGMPPVEGSIDFIPQREAPEADVDHSKLMGFGLTLPDGSFLLVAQDSTRLTDMQHAIVRAFFWSSGLALLLAIAGGAVLGTNFLRRIDTITRTSRAIMEGDLSARIPVRGTQDEIDQLVSSLNAMLARIQQLMDGLRQVSSDIAHDLRTPLGRLRQQLEDARERATSTADYEAATDAAIEEADLTPGDLLRPAAHRPGRGWCAEERLRRVRSVGPADQPRRNLCPRGRGRRASAGSPDRQRRDADRRPPAHRPARLEPSGERAAPHAGRHETLAPLAQASGRVRAGNRRQRPRHPRHRTRQGVRPLLSPSTAAARHPAAASASPW